jgi:SAM-dependent methyltransferase
MNCRHCDSKLSNKVLDLGFQPPSNSYLAEADLSKAEVTYPLRLFVCNNCWLVQTEDYANETEFFSPDYAYFSSTSTSWLEHAKRYCNMVEQRFGLNGTSFVVEIASNDGYLLRNFVDKGIPCLGIEPTDSTAAKAEELNIPVLRKFFGEALAQELADQGKQADLISGNNVYAHVPDINDFTSGIETLLKPEGVVTLEFPHLMRLVEFNQFDTVYHEHFSYLSLYTVNRIFEQNGLRIFDVEEIPTHGGSLRVYGCKKNAHHLQTENVTALLAEEKKRGMQEEQYYNEFQTCFDQVKNNLVMFLLEAKKKGKKVAAYGAAAKGNTLLNYAGVKPDLIPFVCDAAASKQGKFLPGSHIPVLAPQELEKYNPDFVMILPWNIAPEVRSQNKQLEEKGTKFFKAIPELLVL